MIHTMFSVGTQGLKGKFHLLIDCLGSGNMIR